MKRCHLLFLITGMMFLGTSTGLAQSINADNLIFPDFTFDGNGNTIWFGDDVIADVEILFDDTANPRTVSVNSLADNSFSSVRMLSNDGGNPSLGWQGHAEAVSYMTHAVNAAGGENWDRISYTTGNQVWRNINMIQVESGLQGENPTPLLFTMSKPDEGSYVEAMRMDQEGLMVFGLTQNTPRELMVLDRMDPDTPGSYDSHYLAFEGNPAIFGWQMHVDVTSENGDSNFVFGALNDTVMGVNILSITDQGHLNLPADIYLSDPGTGVIVHSHTGNAWYITVDDSGNLLAQSYVAANTPQPEALTDDTQPVIYAVSVNADTVNLPNCSIDSRGQRNYGSLRVGQSLGDTDGSVGIFAEGNQATLLYKIGVTQGIVPTTGPVSELAFYPNKEQTGDFARMALLAMAEGQYRIEQEAGGSVPVAVLEYHTDRADYVDGQWKQSFFHTTAMRVAEDGTCKFSYGRGFNFGPVPISDLGFYLKCPDPVSAGTKDSHAIGFHGKSHDGATVHDVAWQAKVNVTGQAGESAWILTQQIDGSEASEKFRVADDGRVSLTGDAVVTNSNFGLVLRSPNGSHWRVTVDDNGVFQTTAISKTPPFAYNDLATDPLMDEQPIVLAVDLFLDFLNMPKFDIDATGMMTWFGEPVTSLSDVSMSQNPVYPNGVLLQAYNTVVRTSHDLLPSTSVPAAGARTEYRLYRTQDETVNPEYIRFYANAVSGARNEFRIQVEAKGSGLLYPLSNTVSKPSAGFFEEAFRVTPDGRVVFGALRTSPKDVVGLYHYINPAEDHFAVWQGKSHDGFSVHEAWWRAYAPVNDTRFFLQHQLDEGRFVDQMAITIGGELQLRGDLHLSTPGRGVQLRSPNGQYWKMAVNNSGQIVPCPTGDLSGDCVVDELDIELLAGTWLDTGTVGGSEQEDGTVWDAAGDWNRSVNPNGVWSYRNGNINSPDFAELCVNDIAHCGQPLNWVYPGEPLAAYDDCAGVDPDEFLAHGPYLQRWTSNFTGTIKVNGTLWQIEGQPARQMRFLLRHNSVDVAQVAVDWSGQAIDGKANTVTLTLLSDPDIEISVQPGDTIDCILDGFGPNGNGVNTSVGCHFSVTQLDDVPEYVPPLYDLVPDNIINHLDFSVIAGNWLSGL